MKAFFTRTVLLLGLALGTTACLQSQPEQSTNSGEIKSADSTGLSGSDKELVLYDIEDISAVHEANAVQPKQKQDGPREEKIWEHLRGLLEGPCSDASVKALSYILESINRRLENLEKLLESANKDAQIEVIRKRIANLENLKDKVEEKIAECKAGISDCSEKYVKHLKDLIALGQKQLEELHAKLAASDNPKVQAALQEAIQRLEKEIKRIQEILAKCN